MGFGRSVSLTCSSSSSSAHQQQPPARRPGRLDANQKQTRRRVHRPISSRQWQTRWPCPPGHHHHHHQWIQSDLTAADPILSLYLYLYVRTAHKWRLAGWLEKIHPQERAAELAEEEKARQQLQTPTKFAALGANSRSWPERKAERGLQWHCTRLLLLRSPSHQSVRRKRSRAPASQLHHPGGGVRAYAFINHCCPHTTPTGHMK